MKPVSSLHPVLYRTSVYLRRSHRRLKWRFSGIHFAEARSPELLSVAVTSHQSLLRRKLAGTDSNLQNGKVESLKIAVELFNGVLIRPGEQFSFWKLLGNPSHARGFQKGLQLSFGELTSMTGGGLCQLSNLLHWMVLHTPLTITERHRHSTDPFPDYRRTVPFGSGATVFYNYLDFSFRNDTSSVFQINLAVEEEYIHGEIRCDKPLPVKYEVIEKNHRFIRKDGVVYRENELWKREIDNSSSIVVSESLLFRNCLRVLYDVLLIKDITVEEIDA